MTISSIKQCFSYFPTRRIRCFTAAQIIILLASILFVSNSVCADVWEDLNSHEFQENENVEEYIWKEEGSNIPDYPENAELIEVAGPPAYRNYQYLIDGKGLKVGADGVVRYSIVIRSSSGSDNVMHDGLRCITAEIKNYAYGSTNKEGKKVFIPRQQTSWKPVRSTGVDGYSKGLAENYFCDHNGVILTRHEIIQNMKYGKGNVDGLYN